MESINECFLKMLFLKSIRGEFIPVEDGVFYSLLIHFNTRRNVISHSTFDRYLPILRLQSSFVQTEVVRYQMEYSLNVLVNMARNQNY